MTELEELLRTSLARATAHTRRVLGPGAMNAAEVRAFLRGRTAVALSTTGPAGRPHVAVTDLIHHRERFFVGQSRRAASLRHLQREPSVALLLAQGWRRHLIIEGDGIGGAGRPAGGGGPGGGAKETGVRFGGHRRGGAVPRLRLEERQGKLREVG